MTFKKLFFLSLFSIFTFSLFAGGIKGSIKDTKGEPLAFATLYIKSEFTGTTANVEGNYAIKLDPGTYEVIYQYLGYKSEVKRITVNSNSFTEMHIVLQQEILNLEQVVVVAGQENPAYTIMRKAISKSNYHMQQLDSYSASVYMKGSGQVTKVPFFLRKTMKKEGVDLDRTFTSESVSEITYKRPNTYTEKVVSVYSHGDDNSVNPNQFINGSFYEAKVAGGVSPLSPKAFGYYRFGLEGTFFDQGKMINKIKVTPRSRGDKVYEGFIYIVDDEWSIHSLDLTTSNVGITFQIKQIYESIQEKAWLPVSHTFLITGKLLGFGFEYTYLAAASNYEIELNPELEIVDMVVIDETIQKEKAKELKKAAKSKSKKQQKRDKEMSELQAKLSDGKEISRKDLRKMMKNYEKQERKESEAPKVESNKTYTVDSLAAKRDTAYWAAIRPVPLTLPELKSYKIEDSLVVVRKEKTAKDSVKTAKKNRFMPWDVLSRQTVKLSTKTKLHFGSPLVNLNFNTVEGYHSNYDVHLTSDLSKNRDLKIGGKVAYSLARNKVTGKGYLKFGYGSKWGEKGHLSIEGGQYVNQINEENPIVPIFNTFMTLFFEQNHMKLFQKDYISIKNDKYFRPNFRLLTDLEWANRQHLHNRDVRSWIDFDDHDFTSNIPPNLEQQSTYFDQYKAFHVRLGFEYQPWQRYSIKNKVRTISNPDSPLFSLNYKKGIPDVASSKSDFDHIELGYKQKIKVGIRGILSLQTELGFFTNRNNINFVDFKHFMGNRIPFTANDPVDAFRLLDYYNYSTTKNYATIKSHYQFRKFLLTQIMEAQFLGIKENIFVNHLQINGDEFYTEVGYGIDYILRVFRLEFVTSYKGLKYDTWGIRIGIGTNFGGVVTVN